MDVWGKASAAAKSVITVQLDKTSLPRLSIVRKLRHTLTFAWIKLHEQIQGVLFATASWGAFGWHAARLSSSSLFTKARLMIWPFVLNWQQKLLTPDEQSRYHTFTWEYEKATHTSKGHQVLLN
jgi:hypothetical protein